MSHRILLRYVGIFLATPFFLEAQQHSGDLDEVVVVGRAENLVGSAMAASEGRISRDDLLARPMLRVGELLEVVPGMVATQHSGTGKANQYFIRGFNLDHGTDFLARVDGMPVNFPTHGHGQGYLDLNFIIPELVNLIEYRKGPYYADINDFSSAGAADIRFIDRMDRGLLSLGIGEDGYFRTVAADSLDLKVGTLLGALEFHQMDGPWEQPEGLEKVNGVVRFTSGDASDGHRLTLMGYESSWDATDQIPVRAVDRGLISRLGTLSNTNGGDTQRAAMIAALWRERGDHRTDATIYAASYDFNLWSDFTYFLNDPVNGDQFHQFDERVMVGVDIGHTWDARGGARPISHAVGFQVRHDRIDRVGLEQTRSREFVAPIREDAVDQTSLGFYYSNTLQWIGRIRTVTGLRGDAYFWDVDSTGFPQNSGSADDQLLSPKFSFIYGMTETSELYVSAGLGFHSNDGRGTTTTVDPASGEEATPVDPIIQSRGVEVGLRATVAPGLQTTLALWSLLLDSELVFVGDAGTTEPSGETRRVGLEWANFYRVCEWLTFDLDVSYVDAELKEAPSGEREIPGAIPLVVTSGVAISLDNGLFGSLRLRHFDPYPLIEDGSVKSNAATVFNLQTGYRLAKRNLSFHLDVLNLFDDKEQDIAYFYESRLAGEPAEGIADVHFHPMEPRTLRGYVTMRF